jgi:sodium/potassium/calcium exchanger 6
LPFRPAGVFAVLAFVQAIVWLNVSASALVQVCVVVGVIFGLEPALLGATVLAWGNSVPDLINNMAMAKDGFPSMAVAACFASPLFTLLVGMGGALIYGEWILFEYIYCMGVPQCGSWVGVLCFGYTLD